MLSVLLLLAVGSLAQRPWHALPLLVSVSLVYAATRHEELGPILQHTLRFGLWVVVFLAAVVVVTQLVTLSL